MKPQVHKHDAELLKISNTCIRSFQSVFVKRNLIFGIKIKSHKYLAMKITH
jgi:hypothetical protein